MPYEFTLDGVELPVTPGTLKIKARNQNTTVTLINEGEINLLKSPGLTEVQFEVLLPRSRYPFVTGELKEPSWYLGFLARLKTERKHYAETAVDGYLLELAKAWAGQEGPLVVRVSGIETNLLSCPGVVDVMGTTLNGAAKNLELGAVQIPARGALHG